MRPQRAVIAHTAVDAGADPSTADVLEQARLFEEGLEALGIPHTTISVTQGRVWEHAAELAGAVVCNLL